MGNFNFKRTTNKYNNVFTEYKGRLYHSKKEVKVATDLDGGIAAGLIESWEPQSTLRLEVLGQHVCNIIVDFKVKTKSGDIYLEIKSKATMTPTWRLKWKLAHILYPSYNFRVNYLTEEEEQMAKCKKKKKK